MMFLQFLLICHNRKRQLFSNPPILCALIHVQLELSSTLPNRQEMKKEKVAHLKEIAFQISGEQDEITC